MQRPDGFDIGAIEHLTAIPAQVDQSDVAQHLEVLRDGGLAQSKLDGDVGDRPLARREEQQDVAPADLGNGIEYVSGSGGTGHGAIIFLLQNMSSMPMWECARPPGGSQHAARNARVTRCAMAPGAL